ncbi:MAG: mechanosensitive ion channel protein [Firmicutes bacterium HGW-Firmicutes-14]|jgi:MscS family membrane protein|nr:MAG: mechanosensitive ion channel protein [Firmicutes bacterium HGW-Firmicutes-14]
MPELPNYLKGLQQNLDALGGSDITGIAVKVGIAFSIFICFWVFRKVVTRYIFKLLSRFTDKTKTRLDDHIIDAFQKPLQIFFVFLGIYLSLLYLPLSPEHNLLLSRVFRSSLLILIATGFYNFFGCYECITEDMHSIWGISVDKLLVPFFSKVLKVVIIAFAVTIIAQEWDYNVSSLIAGLGLGGLAFALAAKDSAANIFGGVVIITDKPFSIGDWISTPSVEGVVEDINFRSTKIRTFAQAVVTVPNATLANEPVTNYTRMGMRRITFNLGVTYDTSREKIKKCVTEIKNMLETHPEIHPETIFVRFDSFGASSLDIFLYFFTVTTVWGEFLRVKEDINFKIMEILEKEGVSVAFPSTSVYFETPLETKQQ